LPISLEAAREILKLGENPSSQIEPKALALIKDGPRGKTWPSYNLDRFASALAYHAKDARFSIRYLPPGKSAIVVLICPLDVNQKPGVLKFGELSDIEQEAVNYARVERLDQGIKPNPPMLSPPDEDSAPSQKRTGFRSLYYEWAASYTDLETLGQILAAPSVDLIVVQNALKMLLRRLWEWYQVRPEGRIPEFDYGNKRGRIFSQLNRPEIQKLDLPPEIKDLVYGWDWQLRIKMTSVAKDTHGDLNAGNILLTKDSVVRPFLVDFQNLKASTCPARDWTKLERELKFVWFYEALGQSRRGNFSEELQILNNALERGFSNDLPEPTYQFAEIIQQIRQTYFEWVPLEVKEAGMGPVEYFFNLGCWEVEYLSKGEFGELGAEFQRAVLYSTKRAINLLKCAVIQSNAGQPLVTRTSPRRMPVVEEIEPREPLVLRPSRRLPVLILGALALVVLPWLFARVYPENLFRLHATESEVYGRAHAIALSFAPPDDINGELNLAAKMWMPDVNQYAAHVLRDGIENARDDFNVLGKGWYVYGQRVHDNMDALTQLRIALQGPAGDDFRAWFDEDGKLQHVYIKPGISKVVVIQGETQTITAGRQAAEQLFGLRLENRNTEVSLENSLLVLKWHLPPKFRNVSSSLVLKTTATSQVVEAEYVDENVGQGVNSIPYEKEDHVDLGQTVNVFARMGLIGGCLCWFLIKRPRLWRPGLIASLGTALGVWVLSIFVLSARGIIDPEGEIFNLVQFWIGSVLGVLITWAAIYAVVAACLFYVSRELPSQAASLRRLFVTRSKGDATFEAMRGIAGGGLYLLGYTVLGWVLGAFKLAAFSNSSFLVLDAKATITAQLILPALQSLFTFAVVALPMSFATSQTRKTSVLVLIGTLGFVASAGMSPILNIHPLPAYMVMMAAEGAIISWVFVRHGAMTLIAFLITRISYAGALTAYATLKDSSGLAALVDFLPMFMLLAICVTLLLAKFFRSVHNKALRAGV
jgi:hypothetical protein